VTASCWRPEGESRPRRDMIESDSPVGETRRDLIQRRRYAFTVSPQSDQLANFRHPRHFRDQLVLVGQGWDSRAPSPSSSSQPKSCGITCMSACGLPPLGDDANAATIPGATRTMRGEGASSRRAGFRHHCFIAAPPSPLLWAASPGMAANPLATHQAGSTFAG
jgi:hypothetical protein